jgi:hypothetical protein
MKFVSLCFWAKCMAQTMLRSHSCFITYIVDFVKFEFIAITIEKNPITELKEAHSNYQWLIRVEFHDW